LSEKSGAQHLAEFRAAGRVRDMFQIVTIPRYGTSPGRREHRERRDDLALRV
jgi:hypothetical protein